MVVVVASGTEEGAKDEEDEAVAVVLKDCAIVCRSSALTSSHAEVTSELVLLVVGGEAPGIHARQLLGTPSVLALALGLGLGLGLALAFVLGLALGLGLGLVNEQM